MTRSRARGNQRIQLDRQTGTRPLRALATHLADCAQGLRAVARADLASHASPELEALYQQARVEIQSDLTAADFADLLAQVLVYCCLLTRFHQEQHESFTHVLASQRDLPGLPVFARWLLETVRQSLTRGQDAFAVRIRNLAHFLAQIDIPNTLNTFQPECLQGDPLINFYELFLAAYAPHQRSQRGVYYTPAPVIAYIVRAIDELLRSVFAYSSGLSGAFQDEQAGVHLYDPACGMGAFLLAVLEHVRQAYRAADLAEKWQYDLPSCILSHLAGCELMPAPYLLARIKLAGQLAALDLPAGERARWAANPTQRAIPHLFLANALDQRQMPGRVPREGIPVILGNPPYSGHSLDHNSWISGLLASYKTADAGLRRPAQTKWLSDDYVKFLRLGQWQIEQAGRGIMAFLTSHSYLDNPTFRGMRLSLLRCFDEIYILDLHGNSKKRELAPGGAYDQNIFTIQQGVAIGIFVKRGGYDRERYDLAGVHHADVWGPREAYIPDETGTPRLAGGKLGWLAAHDLSSTAWQSCQPRAPFYLFTPQNDQYQAEYATGWSLPAIFARNGDPAPGLVTCQDAFAISWTAAEAIEKVEKLLATTSEAEARHLFRLCSQAQWDYATARQALGHAGWRGEVAQVLYRPFDLRWTVFDRHVAVHLRERVTRHMRAGPNLALLVGRAGQVIDSTGWDIAFCSRLPTEFNLYRRGGNYLFPLYLYPVSGAARVANLASEFIVQACQNLALRAIPEGQGNLRTTLGPEDLFAYMYALLYSPTYRARYAVFLNTDFPRVPLTANRSLFRALCQLGRKLTRLHLMERNWPVDTSWSVAANNYVEKVRYSAHEYGRGQVSINAHQHCSGVPQAVWDMTIGGYQVAKKWLQDRRGRLLGGEEMGRYQQIIAALTHTLELTAEIDRTIEQQGGWPL